MKTAFQPTHVKILHADPKRFAHVKPVTTVDVFQNNTRDFHDDGLFSAEIFGRVGSDARLTRMSYIDCKVPIFHPRIFSHLCSLKQLYKGILSGHEYAIWNEKEKDFEKSTIDDGETGFYFFVKHWEKINFRRTSSNKRDLKIEIIKKNIDVAMTDKVIVIPAGMRDLEVDEYGNIDQHEINDFYRRIISISSTLSMVQNLDSPIIDKARFSLQMAFNELHDYITTMMYKGKGSFMLSKFGRRRLRYGSRNVYSAMSHEIDDIDDPTNPTNNHTMLGIYQLMKNTEPLMIHYMNTMYLNYIFRGDGYAWLVDKKTLERVQVGIRPKAVDKWTTSAGLRKVISSFANVAIRNKPIEVEGHYLGLVYVSDEHYRLVMDISEVPPDKIEYRTRIRPITYGEFFFIILNRYIHKHYTTITRFPIESDGSIYPSIPYITTTHSPLRLVELNQQWEPTNNVTARYPNVEVDVWHDALTPAQSRLSGMGADFDGDTGSVNTVLSKEGLQATDDYMNSINFHVDANNNMLGSPITDIIDRVAYCMTRGLE